ncbi:alpha/beta hydrolase [Rhodococcus rhodochrous]|uniref:alpha/beta hydrolase n=1 Tax=Rhodococcus rhodochrous TaxID=1829 RepID=UPI00128F58A2|nr:alpha/beta hydrolase [Rhodococcus rhodochrous]
MSDYLPSIGEQKGHSMPRTAEIDIVQKDFPGTDLVLSGLYAEHPNPRALIVALHGGGLQSGYFDCASAPELSLLRLGNQLGYSVVALDRPGYGKSAGVRPSWTLAQQAATIWSVLAMNFDPAGIGTGICLVGHSFGAMVATAMAADVPAGQKVLGLEVSGIAARYAPELAAAFAVHPPAPDSSAVNDAIRVKGRSMHWGDERNYPPATFRPGVRPHAQMPGGEPLEAVRWPERVGRIAGAVRAPVHLTLAGDEPNWVSGEEGLRELSTHFRAARWVVTDIQAGTGHNISLSWAALPYHLRAIAFFEDCLLAGMR